MLSLFSWLTRRLFLELEFEADTTLCPGKQNIAESSAELRFDVEGEEDTKHRKLYLRYTYTFLTNSLSGWGLGTRKANSKNG